MTVTLEAVRQQLEARGLTAKITGLGGNVIGLVVETTGTAADQCVLVTIDDGRDGGEAGVSEVELSANYVTGTVGLTEDNGGRRLVLGTAPRLAEEIAGFVGTVSILGRDAL